MKSLKLVMTLFITSTLVFLYGCNDSGTNSNTNTTQPISSVDLNSTTLTPLTDEQKYALAYMWNEERLAYDIYMNLYAVNPVSQLQNIATRSESVHISLVKDLVETYDINITNLVDYKEHYSQVELEAMPSGVYGIQVIQDLYNVLYADGVASDVASLEVGCKVEVTDVNDLDKYIIQSVGNQSLLDTFNILRDGSYQHYWAFDAGLKNLGITDGCCSLGQEFCKTATEYPKN